MGSRNSTQSRHRVVIVGCGFGGLYAAKQFARSRRVEVVIIDRRNFHLFQPLLYQVATGALSPGDIASPVRGIFARNKNVRTLQADVVDFDAANRKVILKDGEVSYDTLIVAAGAKYSYFGRDDWEKLAPGLKTVEDAIEIRHRIFLSFEMAERVQNPAEREAWMTFVLVGGGPTGVELAGALGELAHHTLKGNFRAIDPTKARIILVENSDRLLNMFPDNLADRTKDSLQVLGVTVRNNCRVTDVTPEGVKIATKDGDEFISAKTVLWCAGVKGNELGAKLAKSAGAATDRIGRVIVQEDCSVPGHPEVFVIGDLANFQHGGIERPLPGVAPVAMQMGSYVAKQVLDRLRGVVNNRPFRYRDKGNLAVIGRNRAVADFGWTKAWGFPAWLIWIFVHIMYLVEFDNRVRVFMQWAFHYFTRARGARLITGELAPVKAVADGTSAPVPDVKAPSGTVATDMKCAQPAAGSPQNSAAPRSPANPRPYLNQEPRTA